VLQVLEQRIQAAEAISLTRADILQRRPPGIVTIGVHTPQSQQVRIVARSHEDCSILITRLFPPLPELEEGSGVRAFYVYNKSLSGNSLETAPYTLLKIRIRLTYDKNIRPIA
jgi:hypothetical protein